MLGEERSDAVGCGSSAEYRLQERYGTTIRAGAFYRNQVLAYLNQPMRDFIARQEMIFIATADARGHADCSFRAGPPGFLRVLDDRAVCYPEYRGNGVMASLSNIAENPRIGIMVVDFTIGKIGLHVNGSAHIASNQEIVADPRSGPDIHDDLELAGGRRPERWVVVDVEEAYIHCSKHIPRMGRMAEQDIPWGTDDERAKGGDYFRVRAERRERTDEDRIAAG